ncbi:MAG TPA: hypothetical protein VEI96_01010 [Thermodesulfovibrionales bacterium]|nr:hypothetical protein [Thermodesulfovibrionales bacterium]
MRRLQAFTVAISFTGILLVVGVHVFAEEYSEGWISLKKDVFINGQSIAYPSVDRVSLWVKIVPDSESAFLLEARSQLMAKGREDQALSYDYTGFLSEIDCLRKRHRELITILYDVNKNILHSVDHPQASWEAISPESSFHLIEMAVCREVNC